jgi:hypothetical protein
MAMAGISMFKNCNRSIPSVVRLLGGFNNFVLE